MNDELKLRCAMAFIDGLVLGLPQVERTWTSEEVNQIIDEIGKIAGVDNLDHVDQTVFDVTWDNFEFEQILRDIHKKLQEAKDAQTSNNTIGR